MPNTFTRFWNIPTATFDATGAFDPILDLDTRLFIDPYLLRATSSPELRSSFDRIAQTFQRLFKLLLRCKEPRPRDAFWRASQELFDFPEVSGLCIGYSRDGIGGSGMGPEIRDRVLNTAWQLAGAGRTDPEYFELVGLFEKDVGADRISDMLARIAIPDLASFTHRICQKFGIETAPYKIGNVAYSLPSNPIRADGTQPLILVPKDILRDLPQALDWSEVNLVASQNAELRQFLNGVIGKSWREASQRISKEAIRSTILTHPEVFDDLVRQYIEKPFSQYDFADDPSGEVQWLKASLEAVQVAPLGLSLPPRPSIDEIEEVALRICRQFRELVEDNQLAKLLYEKNGKPKHESAAQLLFFGIAHAYCEANNLDLSPEANSGRGPVDFKFSRGFKGKVLVEAKLTSNKQLKHGFEQQLKIYQNAEKAHRAIYLVLDNGGASVKRIREFHDIVRAAGNDAPKVIWIDAVRKPSASKNQVV